MKMRLAHAVIDFDTTEPEHINGLEESLRDLADHYERVEMSTSGRTGLAMLTRTLRYAARLLADEARWLTNQRHG